MKKLSTLAQALADEINAQDWSDAHSRADGARHDREVDSTKAPQLSPRETETVQVNVMWVVAQALSDHDPNFDVHAFAEASGVSRGYRLRKDGGPSGGIDAGIRRAPAETYTPVQLAQRLGYTDEARPGKVVRDYLRGAYPQRAKKYERWVLSQAEADDVLANVPSKR